LGGFALATVGQSILGLRFFVDPEQDLFASFPILGG